MQNTLPKSDAVDVRGNETSDKSKPSKKADVGPDSSAQTDRDLADYLCDMAKELSILAMRAKMPTIAYFLNLARLEAAGLLRDTEDAQGIGSKIWDGF